VSTPNTRGNQLTIQPDTKDWTWVLDRACPECGLDAGSVGRGDVAKLIRGNADAWVDVVRRKDVNVRPRPDVWSPLEYACHVRDVLHLSDERLQLMLEHDDPLYANWDQDETAVAQRYDLQNPAAVEPDLQDAASRVADRFARLQPEQWLRTGRRSDGASFTVESFSRYFLTT
jgi:hypothetical protein